MVGILAWQGGLLFESGNTVGTPRITTRTPVSIKTLLRNYYCLNTIWSVIQLTKHVKQTVQKVLFNISIKKMEINIEGMGLVANTI
jgi:hypothetical protein